MLAAGGCWTAEGVVNATLRILVVGICSLVLCLFSTFGEAQQETQPQFTTGGIRVVVNRAVRHANATQFVLSLIVTNLGDEEVALGLMEMPTLITDTGGGAEAVKVSGIPFCNATGQTMDWCIEHQHVAAPALIDRQNSITVTLIFRTNPDSEFCSVDFSMPLFTRRGDKGRVSNDGGDDYVRRRYLRRRESADSWQQITVGLPNVRVC
jgi:hypothetical protein